MSGFSDNHYVRLGLPLDATADEIRESYLEAARRLHPDTNADPAATEQFIQVKEAYDVLSNVNKRKAYDMQLPAIDRSPGVGLTISQSTSSLPFSDEPQLFYALVNIEPAPVGEEAQTTRTPLNLGIVIDRSTSMSGRRMETVKAATETLITQLQPEDYLSVVTFSDFADVVIPATRDADWTRLRSQIGYIQPGGGTEIYRGLKAGVQEVSRFLKPSFRNNLILITDGHTYGDEQRTIKLAKQASDMGITLNSLGVGSEWNEVFLDQVSACTGGASMYLSDPKEIKRFMELKFKDLNQIYAENVRLEIKNPSTIEVKYGFRLSPDPGPLTIGKKISLGNVPQQSELTVLFEFLVNANAQPGRDLQISNGTLKVDIPSKLIPTSKLPFNLSVSLNDDGESTPPPRKIIQAMSSLTLYRMQELAREDLARGDVVQATKRLKNLATHLLSQGENNLASTVLLEASRIERGKAITQKGGKQIKYGTRALLLPPGMET